MASLADRLRPVLLSLVADSSPRPAGGNGVRRSSPRLMIAVSGGVDSTVLLRLVRDILAEAFPSGDGPGLLAAHLDHGMRDGSAGDAREVLRLCNEWDVACTTERVSTAPASETDARRLRYAFLDRVAAAESIDLILTGHHADDEVETLLHRISRGTGLVGLRGIPRRRGRYCRPFLMARPPVRRRTLEDWVAEHALPIREDPTNLKLHTPRNRIRHRVLPELDRVRDGARANLLRLARNARRSTAELHALADAMLIGTESALEIEVSVWQAGSVPLRRALLRRAMERMGVQASEAVTRAALQISPEAQSGRGIDLPGGLRFERCFDRWVLTRTTDHEQGGVVPIPNPEPGSATLRTPGRTVRVVWAAESQPGAESLAAFDLDAVTFPLMVRGWRPGDRIARSFGHTRVAQWLSEQRVPRQERVDQVVVEDAHDRVVAVAGIGAADGCAATPQSRAALHLHLLPARESLPVRGANHA